MNTYEDNIKRPTELQSDDGKSGEQEKDQILDAIGGWGRWQQRILIVMVVIWMVMEQ